MNYSAHLRVFRALGVEPPFALPGSENVISNRSSRADVSVILTASSKLTRNHYGAEGVTKRVAESDLLDPYEKFVAIEIVGHAVEVPENNRLLRCFQFLSLETISYGDFCWNGDCTNCQFWYHEAGQTEAHDRTALACRFDVREGIVVTRLSPHLIIEGINKR